ncbi:MAG: hypothetical protein GY760_26805 [Deltaproteobacteria bacterium]|nr:hypothetical protein [Deltaproteobacteria bacterium]
MSIEKEVLKFYNEIIHIPNQLIINTYSDNSVYIEYAQFENDYSSDIFLELKVINYSTLKPRVEEIVESGDELHGSHLFHDKIPDGIKIEKFVEQLKEKLKYSNMEILAKDESYTIYWIGDDLGNNENPYEINWQHEEQRMYSYLVRNVIAYFEEEKLQVVNINKEKKLKKVELFGAEFIRYIINDNPVFDEQGFGSTEFYNPTIELYMMDEPEEWFGRRNFYKLLLRILEKLKSEVLLEKYTDKGGFIAEIKDLDLWVEPFGHLVKFAQDNMDLPIDEYMEKSCK